MAETFSFDDAFQKHFLNHCLRDSEFLAHVEKELKPEMFTNESAQKAARLILDFGKKESSAPDTLIFTFIKSFEDRGLISKENTSAIRSYIDELFGLPLQNRQFLMKEFGKFTKHQLFKRNIMPISKLVKKGEMEKAEEMMKEIFLTRIDEAVDLGGRYVEDPSDRITRRKKEDTERFWTLIPELDSTTLGLKRGELGIWQSQRSSAGKSAALVFLARSFAFQAKRVLIYTLEMSREDYEDRLDMCIAGVTKQLLGDRNAIQSKLRPMFKNGGDIWIKQFPGKMTTISDLMKHKKMIEATHNFHADAILIDYMDELAPEQNDRTVDNSYSAGKAISSMLRGWAIKDQVAMWSAIQSNRGAAEAVQADMEHSSESMAKIFVADLIVSINRTAEEERQMLTRLFKVKDRRGPARYPLTIQSNFEKMAFYCRTPTA